MALVIGNTTIANTTPAANSFTIAHNQNAGSDKYLLVSVTMSNGVNFTGATYNGVPMVPIIGLNDGSQSQRVLIYGLATTSAGVNNIVVSFTGSVWNPISFFAGSFTGSGGSGDTGSNSSIATPNAQTLTVSANSLIFATGMSVFGQSFPYTINGVDVTALYNGHNTNRIVEGAYSNLGLPAGSIDVVTKADAGTVSNVRIEITEAGGVVPSNTGAYFLTE